MNLYPVIATVISGIILGSIYALIAVGLSLCWGTIKIFNFAQGALLTLSAYLTWYLAVSLNMHQFSYLVVIIIVCSVMFGIGVALERVLVKPIIVRSNTVILAILTTLSASTFLQNSILLIFGPRGKQLPKTIEGVAKFGGQVIGYHELLIVVLVPFILLGFWLFLKRTKVGMALRSVEQNREAALLMGINVSWVYSLVFGISTSMAALGGIMLGSIYVLTPAIGAATLLKAFIIVVLGGLGSFEGTILACYVVALIEVFSTYFVGLFWTRIILFALMILILILRPTGLLGEAE